MTVHTYNIQILNVSLHKLNKVLFGLGIKGNQAKIVTNVHPKGHHGNLGITRMIRIYFLIDPKWLL